MITTKEEERLKSLINDIDASKPNDLVEEVFRLIDAKEYDKNRALERAALLKNLIDIILINLVDKNIPVILNTLINNKNAPICLVDTKFYGLKVDWTIHKEQMVFSCTKEGSDMGLYRNAFDISPYLVMELGEMFKDLYEHMFTNSTEIVNGFLK